jgi:elongation factor G
MPSTRSRCWSKSQSSRNRKPSFRVWTDHESGQTILKRTSEFHLDTKLDLLRCTYMVAASIGAPQVAFLEHPTKRVEVEYTHKKIHGPKGEFAAVKLVIEPNESGKGYQFEPKIVGTAVPKAYIPASRGVSKAC